MLPTPSTSHVAFDRIYEPAEDSYLLLDTLSSEVEKIFLQQRFALQSQARRHPHLLSSAPSSLSPLVVEIGTGSGVILSFLHAHAETILGRSDSLTVGVDINRFACIATEQTIKIAEDQQLSQSKSHGFYLGNILGDLSSPFKPGMVDILIFNPPYVPTSELPDLPPDTFTIPTTYDDDSHLLALSYAGGFEGMETTKRLLASLPRLLSAGRGCAYILLCAQNQPEKVKGEVKSWGNGWDVETVGTSGKRAGWERLQVIRVWRK